MSTSNPAFLESFDGMDNFIFQPESFWTLAAKLHQNHKKAAPATCERSNMKVVQYKGVFHVSLKKGHQIPARTFPYFEILEIY